VSTRFAELARYDAWANALVVNAVRALPNPSDDRVMHLLSHLLSAKEIWIGRIRGQDVSAHQLWRKFNLEDAAPRLAAADAQLIDIASADDAQRTVHYTNQAGVPFENSLADLITHMVNHGTYHRGQLATAIQSAGGAPPTTDFIAWVRSGRAQSASLG
jgi:uncharacterized damage-inducible protein DinB